MPATPGSIPVPQKVQIQKVETEVVPIQLVIVAPTTIKLPDGTILAPSTICTLRNLRPVRTAKACRCGVLRISMFAIYLRIDTR